MTCPLAELQVLERSLGPFLMLHSWLVRDDLDAIGHAYDWWRKCKNREDWRATIQVLLDVPSP